MKTNTNSDTTTTAIVIGEKIGYHVILGHYSNLHSSFADERGFFKVKYTGPKKDSAGRVWQTFTTGFRNFACCDYTRKCNAYAYTYAE